MKGPAVAAQRAAALLAGSAPAVAGLLAVALLLATAAGAAQEDEAARLEKLQRAIAERRERVAAYEHQERSLFDAIEATDAAARALTREVARADRAVKRASAELAALDGDRANLERKLAATERALSRRAVALYKAGAVGPVRMVFAPGSLRDRLGRIQALQLLLDHDRALLDRTAAERAAVAQARAEAEAAAKRQEAARERLAKRHAQLEEERQAKRALLTDVRRDRARERALLNELEAAARALEDKLADLRSEPSATPPAATPFAVRRGQLDPPVPTRIARRFGRVVDEEYRTQTFRKGVDFDVQVGDPVYAVAAGTVRFAGWFSGYGRMLILDHGDEYFTVMGHLDTIEVAVGDVVASGDRVGTAGETGSLAGPILYFEIRHGPEALDPAHWLRLAPDL